MAIRKGRGGELQPEQAGTAVAQLSLYMSPNLRLNPGEWKLQAGNHHTLTHSAPGLWAGGPGLRRPKGSPLLRGDAGWGNEDGHAGGGARGPALSVQIAADRNWVMRAIERAMSPKDWHMQAPVGRARRARETAGLGPCSVARDPAGGGPERSLALVDFARQRAKWVAGFAEIDDGASWEYAVLVTSLSCEIGARPALS